MSHHLDSPSRKVFSGHAVPQAQDFVAECECAQPPLDPFIGMGIGKVFGTTQTIHEVIHAGCRYRLAFRLVLLLEFEDAREAYHIRELFELRKFGQLVDRRSFFLQGLIMLQQSSHCGQD